LVSRAGVLAAWIALAALVGCSTEHGFGGTGADLAEQAGDLGLAAAGDLASSPSDLSGPPPDPALPGPFAVGVRTLMVTDAARGRTLPVDVWYPAGPGGTANEYRLEIFSITVAQIASPARRDAPALPGPWPAIMFSHGFGGIRFQSYFLTEHLASHGYVVLAPDHPGNTLADVGQLGNEAAQAQSAIDRPLDMISLLDHLPAAFSIDPQRVGITGHSFGGWTSLEVARRDSRFRVVFPLAPGFRKGSTPAFVAQLARPLAIFGGSKDETCSFAENQQAPYDVAQNPRFLVEILGAGHLDFSNLCEVALAKMFTKDGCDPASIDPMVVQARVQAIGTAFAHRYLRDDLRYQPFLEPAYVSALGQLTYSASP
jgi:predicted dienelactone hydrolase